jgi:hypothetical protein
MYGALQQLLLRLRWFSITEKILPLLLPQGLSNADIIGCIHLSHVPNSNPVNVHKHFINSFDGIIYILCI